MKTKVIFRDGLYHLQISQGDTHFLVSSHTYEIDARSEQMQWETAIAEIKNELKQINIQNENENQQQINQIIRLVL